MGTRFFLCVTLAAVACLAGCKSAGRNAIRIVERRDVEAFDQEDFECRRGAVERIVTLRYEDLEGWRIAVTCDRGREPTLVGAAFCCLREAGVVRWNGADYVYYIDASGGTGSTTTAVAVLDPWNKTCADISLCQSSQCTDPVPDASVSDGFFRPARRAAREIAAALLPEHGYLTYEDVNARQDDPEYSYFFWKQDNWEREGEPMRLRRYPGPSPFAYSITAELETDRYLFRGCFKAGVEAYDKQTGEFFIVYHPYNMYDWPTRLADCGPWLAIRPGAEDDVLIDMRDWSWRRLRSDALPDGVRVEGQEIILDDGCWLSMAD